MKWKKQLCAAAAVLLALGIALAGVLLNQHFLVLSISCWIPPPETDVYKRQGV